MQVGSKDDSHNHSESNRQFLIAYLILHIMSYIIYLYSKRDLKLNGKPDVNGVLSASKESLVNNIEIFVNCVIVGVTLKHLYDTEPKELHFEGL